jgi:class 3 adenylate cyclase/tetratricopeptide (TPR) repeat protein
VPVEPTDLTPFVSEVARVWDTGRDGSARSHPGTLVFADISGFTRLTERLAAKGRFGAEEMSDHLDLVLSALLESAYGFGGWLVKWGGDALLLMYDGPEHAQRACAGAAAMRASIQRVGSLDTSVGRTRLRMSVGIHTGVFDLALVGPVHRELLITGDDATVTARLEASADAGEILVSPATAELLPERCRGAEKEGGVLLARAPDADASPLAIPALGAGIELAGLMPELVYRHLMDGGGSGEHRNVAVGFLEFSGFSDLATAAGPEAVMEGVRHVVEVTQWACQRYQVSFHETDIAAGGGKVMLVAGAPRGVDDPAEAMLCTLREVLDDPGGLSLRAGVTAGRVFTGAVGPAFRRSYSVKGDTVNLAARIMGKTPPGSLWTQPGVVESSRTTFGFDPVPPFAVKGKVAPVHAVSVGAPLERRGRTVDLPVIGRDREISVLDEALDRARRGHGCDIEIVGGAGTGKTRLLDEVKSRAGAMTVISAAGEPFRSASPYALSRSLLLEATGMRDLYLGEVPDALRAWIREHAPSLEPWLPLLGTVLQTSFPETPETSELAEEFRGARLRMLILETMAAALPGPTVIVVDDVHFADPASRDVLTQLVGWAADRPWLVLTASPATTGDHETDEPASFAAAAGRLVLEPLGDEAAEVLVVADTDDAPLAPHVLAAVVERGAGNPLFLRTLARTAGSITDAEDLPASVETLVTVQIDRLPPASREVLRAAAVIGMHVHKSLLSELLPEVSADAGIEHALAQLDDFLGPDDTEPVGGRQLRFRQAVVREAAYDGLPYRRRRALHARLAEILDARAGATDAGAAVRSLHHFHAGNDAVALSLGRHAADRASAAYANVEALLLYRRSLESARRMRTVAVEDRADMLERMGDVQLRLGEYGASDSSYGSAARLRRGEALVVARIGMKTARSASQRGDFPLTFRRLRRVQHALDREAGAAVDELRIEAASRAAWTQYRQGRLQKAREGFAAVLDQADEGLQPEVVADALGMLDVLDASLGIASDGDRSQHALRLYRKVDGLAGQARIRNQLGMRAYYDGRWDDAVASYRQAQQLYLRLGDLPNAAINDANVAEILVDQNRLDEAEEALAQALRIWRASGADHDAAFGLALLGRVRVRQGRFDEAEELIVEARRRFRAQAARGEVVDADAYLAECMLLRGSPERARDLAEAALRSAAQLSAEPTQAPLLYRILAQCHDQLGDHEAAEMAFVSSIDHARRRGADHEVVLTVRAMAERAGRQGRALDDSLLREAIPMQRRLGLVIDLASYERTSEAPARS